MSKFILLAAVGLLAGTIIGIATIADKKIEDLKDITDHLCNEERGEEV